MLDAQQQGAVRREGVEEGIKHLRGAEAYGEAYGEEGHACVAGTG